MSVQNKIGKRIVYLRKKKGMTQTNLAEKLNVTSQAVSSWERDEAYPDIIKILDIAKIFDVTTDYILGNNSDNGNFSFTDENKMITYVKGYTNSKNMVESQKALQFAREKHKHQKRKGGKSYIIHPLTMVCNALAMGIDQDEIIATILLHDVCEDCNVKFDELPVNETIVECVKLLTYVKKEGEAEEESQKKYYDKIINDENATIIKLLDRCHNVSNMCEAFSKEKIRQYIDETRIYILPLQKRAKIIYPQWNNVLSILKYHISSVIDSVENIMNLYDQK